MMILKIEYAKNKCLSTIWSTDKIPDAWTYPAREHYKNATWFLANFLVHIFAAWLQTICNATAPDTPLHRYKRNWPITCDLPESCSVLRVAFLILSGILVISRFGFEGWIWVLIATIPDLCILFTFKFDGVTVM